MEYCLFPSGAFIIAYLGSFGNCSNVETADIILQTSLLPMVKFGEKRCSDLVKEYLNALKTKGNFSWSDLSNMSGIPDATIRKIFSGETADPRLETVAKLVTAMGGSMDELVYGKKKDEVEMNAIMVTREIYEARIADIKESSAEHINSLKRDKRYLAFLSFGLIAFLLLFLLVDLLVGSIGWIRY